MMMMALQKQKNKAQFARRKGKSGTPAGALFLDVVLHACGLRPAVHLPTVGESPRGPTVLEPRPAYVHYKYAGRVIMASAVYNTLARDHSPGLSTMSASVPSSPWHP